MDVSKLLNSFLGNEGTSGSSDKGQSPVDRINAALPGGFAGGAAAGGLMGLVLGTKKGRKLGGKALKVGGMAVVGGLAYKAYRDWQTNKTSGTEADPLNLPKPPADSGFDLENDQDAAGRDFRLAIMRAMISAAKSDDHIDQEEHDRIREQIQEFGLGQEEKAALFDYFSAPADANAVARLARTDEQRAELYMASALAVDPDTDEEQRYLAQLAQELSLPVGLKDHLDAEVAAVHRQVST
ncbi:tellurite resistance TerB family protein [Qingshengfaniella alkalisoli]|uniref:Tellurite resistance TerB family protein n=1 Tax=Qingshengfaniella alkalisoli TaxID=2599296 RepID=A0A5B8IXE6_9RHOB|nr:tellurite resistance TerB family protein [Qingshengfaniella alkalisoli]QDY70384.1 tellurite resistance TerB family protein [Qingshengfaniella alkalisoli]